MVGLTRLRELRKVTTELLEKLIFVFLATDPLGDYDIKPIMIRLLRCLSFYARLVSELLNSTLVEWTAHDIQNMKTVPKKVGDYLLRSSGCHAYHVTQNRNGLCPFMTIPFSVSNVCVNINLHKGLSLQELK